MGADGQPSWRDTGSAVGKDELAISLSKLARSLRQQDKTLVAVVEAVVELMPGVREGSISVVMSPRQVGSQAVSGELRRRVDAVQAATGQGPCPDAVYEEQTVRIPDMRTETRWPTLAQWTIEVGGGSMLSLQLYVSRGQTLVPRPTAAQGSATHHVEKLKQPSVSGLSGPKPPSRGCTMTTWN